MGLMFRIIELGLIWVKGMDSCLGFRWVGLKFRECRTLGWSPLGLGLGLRV